MKRFVVMLLVALLALATFPGGARAQGTGCTLAEADCKLLADADTNAAKITSFEQAFDFQLKVNSGTTNVEITSKGKGVLAADAAMMSASDPTAALGGLKATLDLEGATKGTGSSDQSGKIQIVVVDGVLYINDGKAGWIGVKLADLLTQAMAQSGGTGGATAAQTAQIQALLSDPAVLQSISAIPNIKGFITQEKAAGPDIDGKPTTAFVYKFDIKALLAAKEIYPLIKAIAKSSNPTGPEITDAQIEQFAPLVGSVLTDSVITVTRYVNADGFPAGVKLYIQLKLDTAMLGGGSGGAATTADLLFSLDVQLSKINQTFEVKAPEGAKMQDISGMMNPGGSGMPAPGMATPEATAVR
jgi:hypothetical protein